MERTMNRKLVLEDGSEYYGYAFGSKKDRVCEIVFNTSMAGYQEIMSDPAYTNQMIVMTYPLIGNYGMADEDFESRTPTCGGLIVREYNDNPSNFRSVKTLGETMEEYEIPGIAGMDTRKLTRVLRDNGSCKAMITDADTPTKVALKTIKETVLPFNLVEKVACKKRWYARTANAKYNVVAIDCGIKLSLIKALKNLGCNLTIVPYTTPASEVEGMKPDGIILSDGPGSPESVPEVSELISKLKGKYPIFGVGLGHQLVALSYGARIVKLKHGHHGANHPIKNLDSGKIETYPQNHDYTVDPESVNGTKLTVSQIDIIDNSIMGLECKEDKIFTAQYDPKIISGPDGTVCLFDKFVKLMKEAK